MSYCFFLILPVIFTSVGHTETRKAEIYPGTFFVRTCFVKCQDFLSFSENDKSVYIMGIIDGFFGAMMFGADDRYIAWLHEYTRGKNSVQLAAIVTRYLMENPTIWNKEIQFGVTTALYRGYLSQCQSN